MLALFYHINLVGNTKQSAAVNICICVIDGDALLLLILLYSVHLSFFFYLFILQVTWLVVTEVQSKSLLRAGYSAPSLKQTSHYRATSLKQTSQWETVVIVKCDIAHFLCAMHIFEVRASSSIPQPLGHLWARFHFFAASVAQLAHGEK